MSPATLPATKSTPRSSQHDTPPSGCLSLTRSRPLSCPQAEAHNSPWPLQHHTSLPSKKIQKGRGMSRIAVNMASDTVPVTGLDELQVHLDQLIDDPSLDLQRNLFDHVELQLTDSNIPALIPRFLPKITTILQAYQQDPAVLCSLAIRLLGPLTLTQVLSLASQDALVLAMTSPAPSANLLSMSILAKGARSAGDAAILAVMKPLITAFVTTWLSSPHVEVGEKGSRVLGNLLEVDCDVPAADDTPTTNGDGVNTNTNTTSAVTRRQRQPGQGLLWRRIFQDRDIYGLILSLSSHAHPNHSIDDKQRTLAQGRILRILPRLAALNLPAVSRSEFADLTREYSHHDGGDSNSSGGPGQGGLLHFAALHMIDSSDMLMQLTLTDFFETLVSIQATLPYSAYRVDVLRGVLESATLQSARDNENENEHGEEKQDEGQKLRRTIRTLPERTVPEESEELARFIAMVLP